MVVTDELILNVRANTAQAIAGLSAVEKKTKSMSATVGGAMASAGAGLTRGLTAPILGVSAIGIKAFAEFDQQMTQSLAIMSDNALDWRDDMEKAAREVGKTTTFSAAEAAEAYFFLASAGLDAQQSIGAMPQVAKFAQAGMFDLATATDLATDAQSALGMTVDDPAKNLANLTRVTDTLVRANTLANASVEQFSSALTTKAGAAARTLGMDIEETTAVLAVMADAGVKGQVAGTQLAMALNNMTTNAVKNSKEFKEYGIQVFDASGEMRNMADIVDDMSLAFGDMSDEQKVAAIAQLGFGDRAAGTLKVLLGQGDAIREYEGALRDSAGFTDRVASKQLESFSNRWAILKGQVMDVAITIGNILMPPLTNLFEKLSPWIEKLGIWIENNEELATKLIAIAVAAGPVLWIIGKLIGIFKLLNPWVLLAVGVFIGLNKILEHFGFTWRDLPELIGKAVEKIKEWVGKLDFSKFVEKIQEVWNKIWEGIQGVIQWFRDTSDDWREIWDTFYSVVKGIWEDIWEWLNPFIQKVYDFFIEIFGGIVSWFQENWPTIQDAVINVLNAIKWVWDRVWPTMRDTLNAIWGAIERIIRITVNIVKGIIEVFLAILTMDWTKMWEGIKKVVKGAWDGIQAFVQNGIDIVKAIFRRPVEWLLEKWSKIWSGISGAAGGAWETIKSTAGAAIKWIADRLDDLIGAWNNANLFFNFLDIPKINFGETTYAPTTSVSGKLAYDISRQGGDMGGYTTAGAFQGGVALAKGGVVTKPTTGIFGEAGKEAVLPLEGSGFRVLVDAFKEAMGSGGMGGMGGDTVLYIDGREIARATARYNTEEMDRYRRAIS